MQHEIVVVQESRDQSTFSHMGNEITYITKMLPAADDDDNDDEDDDGNDAENHVSAETYE